MMMRKPARGAAVFGATTALVVAITIGTAFAATRTWTVSPGGKISAKSGTTVLTDKSNNVQLKCTSSVAKATLKHGRHLAGKAIGKIRSVKFSNCTGPGGVTLTVTSGDLPWKLNAVSYKSGVTKGTITGIHASLSNSTLGCSMTVDGTSATANNGKVKATYSNKTHKLTILAGGDNLHVYNVSSGCLGLVTSGDASSFKAAYAVSPKQKITSP